MSEALQKATQAVIDALHDVPIHQYSKTANKAMCDLIAALDGAQKELTPTSEDIDAQNWAGMDGAIAFHLIERHSENWGHAGRLMEAWRLAQQAQAVRQEIPMCSEPAIWHAYNMARSEAHRRGVNALVLAFGRAMWRQFNAMAAPQPVCDFVQVDVSGKFSRSQHDADSKELRRLCAERDELRRWKSTHAPRLEVLEELRKHAQREAAQGMEARSSLASEREANAILTVELAGYESTVGHLSALVDDLRGLLSEAMRIMKALHESASPDDGPEMNAVIPAGAFRQFVDANAALMHAIHISPHGDGSAAPQQGSKTAADSCIQGLRNVIAEDTKNA